MSPKKKSTTQRAKEIVDEAMGEKWPEPLDWGSLDPAFTGNRYRAFVDGWEFDAYVDGRAYVFLNGKNIGGIECPNLEIAKRACIAIARTVKAVLRS